MHSLLCRLRHKCAIGYVSGGDLAKQQRQLSTHSVPVTSLFDFCFAENGLIAFRMGVPLSGTSFIEWIGEIKYKAFISWVLKYIANLDIPVKRGTFVEFRNGMVNISPIGQGASYAEMDEFQRYDKAHGIRKTMVEALERQFPDLGMKYSIGGKVCFDAFPAGWDKTYCLRHIEAENERSGLVYDEIHFFGDMPQKGGNDHELYEDERTIGHTVVNPKDTMRQLRELFDL
jgi:phosphomannomutase